VAYATTSPQFHADVNLGCRVLTLEASGRNVRPEAL